MTRDEADANLRAAIQEHATAYGFADDDELLNEYAVIAHWSKIEADGTSNYTVHFHQPDIPQHTARGLYRMAESLVGEEPERE